MVVVACVHGALDQLIKKLGVELEYLEGRLHDRSRIFFYTFWRSLRKIYLMRLDVACMLLNMPGFEQKILVQFRRRIRPAASFAYLSEDARLSN